jgi:phage-related protein
MPSGVRRQFNTKLRYLSNGALVSGAKSWSGAGPAAREYASGGYRMVVTTEFDDAVHVLHAFKKDGLRGRKTRKHDSDLAERRYKDLCQERGARAPKH